MARLRNRRARLLIILSLVIGGLAVVTGSVQAQDLVAGETIPEGTTFNNDAFLSGDNVVIDGTVNGDVLAVGRRVTINGEVTGSLVAAAEVVACYVGLRDCLPTHWALTLNDPLNTCVDNSQVVSLARNGHSESLHFVHKAANMREGWLKNAGRFGWCRISKIRTEHNRSNLLTKPVKPAAMSLERALAGLLD